METFSFILIWEKLSILLSHLKWVWKLIFLHIKSEEYFKTISKSWEDTVEWWRVIFNWKKTLIIYSVISNSSILESSFGNSFLLYRSFKKSAKWETFGFWKYTSFPFMTSLVIWASPRKFRSLATVTLRPNL